MEKEKKGAEIRFPDDDFNRVLFYRATVCARARSPGDDGFSGGGRPPAVS